MIYLQQNINSETIAIEAHKKRIMINALSGYFADKNSSNVSGLVLGFGNSNQKEIQEFGKILCRIIQKNLL